VLAAKPAIFIHFKPIRVVFLVFYRVVVALLAFRTGKRDFNSHVDGYLRITENFTPSFWIGAAPFASMALPPSPTSDRTQ
jgi:hypothetical protein